jgi:Raf kinase inhibitor-like YbhB/YbcL family protein
MLSVLILVASLVVTTPLDSEGEFPVAHTCDGQYTSPALTWSQGPSTTKSFAVTVEDDAGNVHWIVTNLPAAPQTLQVNTVPSTAFTGWNGGGYTGWAAPCPVAGKQRYTFTVYALDIDIPKQVTKPELAETIEGHVLAKGLLEVEYTRRNPNSQVAAR